MEFTTYRFEGHDIRAAETPEGPQIVALDIVTAIGLKNITVAMKVVPDAERQVRPAPLLQQPSRRMIFLTSAGVVALLSSKATPAAERCLAWVKDELFPAIFEDAEPMIVREAAKRLSAAASPWSGADIDYEGHDLYEDPATHKFWATQKQIGRIFGCTSRNVGLHLQWIFEHGFLEPDRCIRKDFLVVKEADRQVSREIILYNFQAICAVGDRASSEKALAFRNWRADWLENMLTKREQQVSLDTHQQKIALDAARIRVETNDFIFEARLAEGVDPFNCAPLDDLKALEEATIALKTYQRRVHNALRVANGHEPRDWIPDETPINADTQIVKCPAITPFAAWQSPERIARLIGPLAPQGVPALPAPTTSAKPNPANDDPDKEERKARKHAAELAYLETEENERLRAVMTPKRPEFSNFKELVIGGIRTGIMAVNADRCADPERYEIGTTTARVMIEKGLTEGVRHVVTTNVDEIHADWAAWIAADPQRKAVVLWISPDPKQRAAWAARLAQVLADDGETRH